MDRTKGFGRRSAALAAMALAVPLACTPAADAHRRGHDGPHRGGAAHGRHGHGHGHGIADPAALVNPLVGTTNAGDVFPGAVRPFGMVAFSPDSARGDQTRSANPGGYDYNASAIRGFSLTHISGAGCAGAGGDVPFMPYVGDVTTSPSADVDESKYASRFSHADETARAGSYDVTLANGVRSELTATERTAYGRFTYPSATDSTMLVRTSSSLVGSTDADVHTDARHRTISGSVTSGNFCGYIGTDGTPDRRSYYTLYFHARFDRPFARVGTWEDGAVHAGSTDASGGTSYDGGPKPGGGRTPAGYPTPGKGSGAYVSFDTTRDRTVRVRVGVSYVSAAGARRNLEAESPEGTSFDKAAAAAHAAWNRRLGQIAIGDGGTSDERTTFYTALYHALIHMSLFSDVDGRYRGFDQQPHRVARGQRAQYSTFSGWDVYRSQVQLVALLDPRLASDFAQSLYNQSRQDVNGRWDRWTHVSGATSVMAGDPSASVAASMTAFGADHWDVRGAMRSLVTAATVPTPEDLSHTGWNVTPVGQRPSLDKFLRLHYVPTVSNAWAGAGETLEDATADFGLADLARRLGDERTYRTFIARAQYWQNVFNVSASPADAPDSGYVQDRNEDGSWPAFDPGSDSGFAEGSAAQYTWMVPFNVRGLFAAMGGADRAETRLDAFFHRPDGSWALSQAGGRHADVSNEPSIETPWLYDWTDSPSKAQQTVRETMKQLWGNTTGGIPGNDDLGAMSAWYVWAAMGMYPEVAGRADLVLASPLFRDITVRRASGQRLRITAPAAATDTYYVRGVRVDGRPWERSWLPESFARKGGRIAFDLGTRPDPEWASRPSQRPPSYSEGMQPGMAAVAPAGVVLQPGGTRQATLAVQNVTDAPLTLTLRPNGLPQGVTVSAPGGSQQVTVPAGQRTETPLTFAAASDAPDGSRLVDLGLQWSDGSSPPPTLIRVGVASPGNLAPYFDNAGVSRDSHPSEANFDTGGWSYSADALAAAGLPRGGSVTADGLTYTWPPTQPGEPDNLVVAGQELVPAAKAGATRLGFLGSASNGGSSGTGTITYDDGTTQPFTLGFSDWTLGGGSQPPSFGNTRAVTMPYRNYRTGRNSVTTYLFSATVTLVPGKAVRSVTLPGDPQGGTMHVFAIAQG
jgi:predicted alpha-1,2-mannosidase